MSIERLAKRVERNRETRADAKKFDEYIHARRMLYDEAPQTAVMDFYCKQCNSHNEALGHKRKRYGWNLDTMEEYDLDILSALYVGSCRRGHRVERFITDKESDPYFKSPILLELSRRMADDLLQPGDPRFAKVYPKQWAELKRQQEENLEHATDPS